ncbi:MAG: hypothetical protein GY928_04030 [Colwellia sp.]|nr:hypothetical protein [Colwellia sp.]
MIIFANDQSYSNFAVVVFKDGVAIDREVFHTGAINPSNNKKEYGQYFNTVQGQLLYVAKLYRNLFDKYKPDKLVFEGLAFGAKGDRVFQLGGLFYHITTSLCEEGLLTPSDVITVTPKEVKAKARSDLKGNDQYTVDKQGEVEYLKSGKPRLNAMKEKKWVKKALCNTSDAWLVEGYTVSSIKKETGAHDIPDAYYIGKVYLEKN